MLKKILRRTIRTLGYEIVPTGAELNWAFEVSVRSLFRDHEIDLVLDVGANRGQYAHYLRRVIGYDGEILSFEPSPNDFAIVEQRASDDRQWQVYPWALGEQESNLSLNVAQSSDFSSFLQPTAVEIDFPGNRVAEQILVSVKPMDAVLGTLGIDGAKRNIFMKCDTQGYDLQVFRGARQTLAHVIGLQTEISAIPIYEAMPDYLDAVAEMRGYGFEVVMMSPVTMDHGVAIEFDCLMLKRNRQV